jgi:cob(I)alamin adenosyltransferase
VVYISKVYTKFGDAGETMLATGDRISKDAPRIRSYGDIDELNAVLGLLRAELGREPKAAGAAVFVSELDAQLARIQQELFNLGAELSTPGTRDGDGKLKIEPRHVEALEKDIDGWNASLDPLRSFVLPGGGPAASVGHVARTVCRRAERELVALARLDPVRPEAVVYVNRLSDYLFVVCRTVAIRLGAGEVLWDPSST